MTNAKPSETFNFALVGHAGDGKTSLGEAILHAAGARAELGSVTNGSSCLNHLPEEKERHHTISSAVYGFDWNGRHLTLVDTPGDSNFHVITSYSIHYTKLYEMLSSPPRWFARSTRRSQARSRSGSPDTSSAISASVRWPVRPSEQSR